MNQTAGNFFDTETETLLEVQKSVDTSTLHPVFHHGVCPPDTPNLSGLVSDYGMNQLAVLSVTIHQVNVCLNFISHFLHSNFYVTPREPV